jgi:uncharacterized protein YjiS (DUF1127 family)
MSHSFRPGAATCDAFPFRHLPDDRDDNAGMLGRGLRQVRLWLSRHRQRRALADLATVDNHLLRDIGVSLEAARHEAAKPFWR